MLFASVSHYTPEEAITIKAKKEKKRVKKKIAITIVADIPKKNCCWSVKQAVLPFKHCLFILLCITELLQRWKIRIQAEIRKSEGSYLKLDIQVLSSADVPRREPLRPHQHKIFFRPWNLKKQSNSEENPRRTYENWKKIFQNFQKYFLGSSATILKTTRLNIGDHRNSSGIPGFNL